MTDESRQPLSVRTGARSPFGVTTGVPDYLKGSLIQWVLRFRDDGPSPFGPMIPALKVIRALRINKPIVSWDGVVKWAIKTDSNFLDLVDCLLPLGSYDLLHDLAELLDETSHEYAVSVDQMCLVKRFDEATEGALGVAVGIHDEASRRLGEAWKATFGREQNFAFAWHEALCAVEAMLRPIVSPTDKGASFSKMRAFVKNNPEKFHCLLPAETEGRAMNRFVEALHVFEYEPGHHGGNQGVATEAQTRATIFQAVAVVNWLRDGMLVRV